MKKLLSFIMLAVFGLSGAAHANWSDMRPKDDGGRFYVAARGGVAAGLSGANVKNELGAVNSSQLFIQCDDVIADQCVVYDYNTYLFSYEEMEAAQIADPSADFAAIGVVELGKLKPQKNFEAMTWTANFGIGLVLPGASNVRVEGSWDRISEVSYNASPVLGGETVSSGGWPIFMTETGSLSSTVQTDIYLAMVYFDFFDGTVKRPHEFIPYIGLGLGYASSKASMSFIDSTGTLDDTGAFGDFINQLTGGFYFSENYSNGLAAAAAVGFSYGLNSVAFLDFGAKAVMANKIEWILSNPDTGMQKPIVATDGPMIYGIVYGGFRFEF
ncbi:MAG: hypothetical protein LBH81_00285 [Rickettsiales bacterium]|jgi:hypothetical protein|nr:hypothetical protein [Rickettsiales bacterium]